jgi:hypothetical protein
MAKRRFSSCLASDEITTHGYRVLTFAKSTTIMVAELTVMSGRDPLKISWIWHGLVWFWFSLCGIV